jgi:hypothetical protein
VWALIKAKILFNVTYALGWATFVVVHGACPITPLSKFNDYHILSRIAPNMQNVHKMYMKQYLLPNMASIKDVTTSHANLVNIMFTF